MTFICLLCSLLVRGLVLGEEDESDRALNQATGFSDGTVVHLVVRRTAKVNYSVQGSNFELSISASDTAETVKRCALQFYPCFKLTSPVPHKACGSTSFSCFATFLLVHMQGMVTKAEVAV